MMHMTFYWGKQATILFYGWTTSTWGEYSVSLLALFLLSLFHEFLVSRRASWTSASSVKSDAELPLLGKLSARRIGLAQKALQAVLFGVNATVGYLLMLAVMCFNGGVFIAVILGFTLGHFFFRDNSVSTSTASDSETCACS